MEIAKILRINSIIRGYSARLDLDYVEVHDLRISNSFRLKTYSSFLSCFIVIL